MVNFISETYLIILSSFHYFMTSDAARERMSQPSTASFLYNYSLALNESLAEEDQYFKSFHYYGYPADTYAVHFAKSRPYFSIYLQILMVSISVVFFIMACVLAHNYLFDETRRHTKEYKETIEKIKTRVE